VVMCVGGGDVRLWLWLWLGGGGEEEHGEGAGIFFCKSGAARVTVPSDDKFCAFLSTRNRC
jgi:hypothetical protein